MEETNPLNTDVINAAQRAVDRAPRPASNLDFSHASLQIVEDMLAEAATYASGLSVSQNEELRQSFGCYILEVGRRQFGGRYFWHDQYDAPVLVVGEPLFHVAMVSWPRVALRLNGDPADNIPFFYAGFAERAKAGHPGDRVIFV